MSYCVYKHTTPNGKVYIGITCQNPFKRWLGGYGYQRNPHFWNAIVKYGWDNIKHEILFENLTKQEAEQKEMALISEYKSNCFEYGYNRDNGGNCVGSVSKETKEKIKLKLTGRKIPQETIVKRVKTREGYKHSCETREKIRNANIGKPAHNKGIPMTPEIKEKHTQTKLCKSVICIETQKEYRSLHEAERETGINFKNISACIYGTGRRKTAGGYHWEFKENK